LGHSNFRFIRIRGYERDLISDGYSNKRFLLKAFQGALALLICIAVLILESPLKAETRGGPGDFMETIRTLALLGDRSFGTPGNTAAAQYIKDRLARLGFDPVATQRFAIPVRRHGGSTLVWPDRGVRFSINPIKSNAITPETIPSPGVEGPLIYVGGGELREFNGKEIDGAIVLMELDSGKNWLNAANFGARALIYVDRGPTTKDFFNEKFELTPLQFPRFWIPWAKVREIFGPFETAPQGLVAARVRLTSEVQWQNAAGENIYCLVQGTDPELREEMIIVEAFYDSTALVFDRSPGADEACSIATLLELARFLKQSPPARSVLLVATNGHSQTLAGMRELIWSLSARSKDMRARKKSLKKTIKKTRTTLKALEQTAIEEEMDLEAGRQLKKALGDQIKTEVDKISRHLMQLRLKPKGDRHEAVIQKLAGQRLLLRRLGWRDAFDKLTPEEVQVLKKIVPLALKSYQAILSDAVIQLKYLESARAFRSFAREMDIAAVVSLHLSSHGDGLGAFNQGWLYPLKPIINRVGIYSTLDDVLRDAAVKIEQSQNQEPLYRDTLRPSQRRPWKSYFIDRPFLGGEVSAIAGFLGVSLVTVDDSRSSWGTPYDLPETVNQNYALKQCAFINELILYLGRATKLHTEDLPRIGFSTVTGHAKFLRHGELFPDQPAPGSMILAYQGPALYHAIVDATGRFELKGVADKKHVLHKVILEGYKFDPATGSVVWAVDKKQTGKPAYRVKMRRRFMKTDLVMFACKETTMFDLLEPRTFRYMTKLQLIDARREAPPMRYWYSRIDTRQSTISSIYLEPGTRFKMILSDTVLRRKMILTNFKDTHPEGVGYQVDEWPQLHRTEFLVARDMWGLLGPRIDNLESHGIFNERIRKLQQEGTAALNMAQSALASRRYDQFAGAAAKSWALALRVYDSVEKTQKDVLFGVLFYIALFVPFAFCLERFLFSYADIYKRIIAFSVILILLIAVIYMVHPAFQLAYSPMVVILAFFIVGLSLMVTLIIFSRFEKEMIQLQSRARHLATGEITRWKAFMASFFLGVSNLRRRRLRTLLTCTTLIILTFTIMSFTSVKSTRRHARLFYQPRAPYSGFLLKNINWRDLPPEALNAMSNTFAGQVAVAPRIWLEDKDNNRYVRTPVRFEDQRSEAHGAIGLSALEARITGIDQILIGGRWIEDQDKNTVLLPDRMAKNLGIDPLRPEGTVVFLWGVPFDVVGVFSGKKLQEHRDLDEEPLTPAIFAGEVSMQMTEVEMEALESGEDVRSFQSRYQHISGDLTLIVPHRTLLATGGHLKSVAIQPLHQKPDITMAQNLADRFGLTLFSGEPQGTFLYHASNTLSYSGVPNIVIPIIISIFIVLNTMIGSVYERKREIGIYTSVGLAPSHVSFLFIAEAMALAVLSVVCGYLVAQVTARLFAGTSFWAGITVNYSSLAGVAAIVLVILVVLVSVIYPSRVAAEIAIPDVNRSWTMPDPKENVIKLTLPFLVKYREQRSMGGYLYDYFKSHQDVSHGLFSTGKVGIDLMRPRPNGMENQKLDYATNPYHMKACLHLHFRVWLAPFDFGIMQQVNINFCPTSEEPEYLEIQVHLTREAGEVNAWGRINKAFLRELRKQLLIWRSLDDTSQDHYARLLSSARKAMTTDPDQEK